MNDAEKTLIINTWCRLFSVMPVDGKILVLMDVKGFVYPAESYSSISEALEESYVRAHAHTWTVCKHIESQRQFEKDRRK